MRKLQAKLNTRIGLFWLLVFVFWAKTMLAYAVDFHISISDPVQAFIVAINPIGTSLLLFGLAFYARRARFFYPILTLTYILNTVLLYLNVIYFREFTDYMTVSTMTGYDKVNQGLSGSSLALTMPHDVLYWLDLVILILLFAFRWLKFDKLALPKKTGFAVTSFAIMFITFNLAVAEMDRSQLMTRTFDRTYVVKYLGLDFFTAYDGASEWHTSSMRAAATKSELKDVTDFTQKHYAAPNKAMFGAAKGRNVIVIHLESFQQFSIDQKVNGKEVTPFLNSIYHSKDTYAFDNFFHQVGQGKTSDAENMLEAGTYGLPQGSLFAQLGSDETFQAAPAILEQSPEKYTTAVFHGNVPTFWNRNNMYPNLGYQYFFSQPYYNHSGDRSMGYGLKDKLLFDDSVKYLQHLQQPFYVKYLTVTNHFPFELNKEDQDPNFKTTDTDDSAVNNYFVTNHYLDQSVEELFNFLKSSGLYNKSMIVIYGDHYGISNSENKNLASVLGKDPDNWTNFDNAQLQRVPFMVHIPGNGHGKIEHQYGGEIDVEPTLLHLLGINSKKYVQFGTDLFSKHHDQVVAFRNQDFVTPTYTSLSGTIYSNKTGQPANLTAAQKKHTDAEQAKVTKELSLSDSLNQKNLLRFYKPDGFTTVDPSKYKYTKGLQKAEQIERDRGVGSTSLYSQNGNKSIEGLYHTDAPEVDDKGR
ncbi:LTA synthase family protein [Furfurilactobacillus milii]|uniref:LTA synthase family protein n=1 Tax=Furfurilactobacillus milii TaxID=2888272 RepID=A0ABT6DCF0_9LACO|nr:LTA synthase family protein [Furfurilactobacillus milii]QLE67347.1 Lipoteichoic acid synthase LtaS Type IIb [Furfurilactobacillus rossiae]MCF6161572.1 LTA synthase family protein [Furfurilactobacillus milii]MCF6163952.1 LTA synthase family protein [Furfurilactobacillus milii]MDF9914447.1 LTA synthase family protein [Furfurilactobacillus milii]QLE69777.1 Lipoteichoic acid synthase LtaS Type IIb [Furfurilactobacillus rossiae]